MKLLDRLDRVEVIQLYDIEIAQTESLLHLHTGVLAHSCDHCGRNDKMILHVGNRVPGQDADSFRRREPLLFAVLTHEVQIACADGVPESIFLAHGAMALFVLGIRSFPQIPLLLQFHEFPPPFVGFAQKY